MSRAESLAMSLALTSGAVIVLAALDITGLPLAAWLGGWIVLIAMKRERA